MLIESLEVRQLYSVTVQALPGGGLLVKGTNGNDAVQVGQNGTQAVVIDGTYDPNGPPGNQFTPGTVSGPYDNVKYIIVDLGNGDDYVNLVGAGSNAAIMTGNGNDVVDVTVMNSQDDVGNDTGVGENLAIDTGNGNDVITINAIGNSKVLAFAGNGNDTGGIVVADNAQVIYDAGAGNDLTGVANAGSASQVVIIGGSGNDTVSGGIGSSIQTGVEHNV